MRPQQTINKFKQQQKTLQTIKNKDLDSSVSGCGQFHFFSPSSANESNIFDQFVLLNRKIPCDWPKRTMEQQTSQTWNLACVD